jgi:hypothetical protein
MQCELCDNPRWTRADMARRLDFGLRCAHAHGTAAMRCHLDGVKVSSRPLAAATCKALAKPCPCPRHSPLSFISASPA